MKLRKYFFCSIAILGALSAISLIKNKNEGGFFKSTQTVPSTIGHLADIFKNVDVVALKTGDVVKIVPGKIYDYYDLNQFVPIFGIVRCNKEDDNLVVGVVAGPTSSYNTARTTNSITNSVTPIQQVQPGELALVVRAGIFSVCNVDGTNSPIVPGDLLTTSARVGYAQKSINQIPGSIVGKALESCSAGQKTIAVLVSGGQQ